MQSYSRGSYSRPKRSSWTWFLLGLVATFLLIFLICPVGYLLASGNESVSRRIEAIPFYLRTYVNKVRPQPELPAPPAVSAIPPQDLLQPAPISPTVSSSAHDLPAYFNEESLNEGALNSTAPDAPAEPATVAEPAEEAPAPEPASPEPTPAEASAPATVDPNMVSIEPPAGYITLNGVAHQWQTWNNCGPATISMNLSYYGATANQADAAPLLKPNRDDKNVSPEELAAYARSQGFEALYRIGGSLELLKRLLSNNLPVIVEVWVEPEDHGGMGHYRLFTGYDEAGGYFIAEDSLHGSGVEVPIAEFDAFWAVFNRTYILAYPPEQAALVQAILGEDIDDQQMYERALTTAQAEAQANPDNAYAWFNIGTNYARLDRPTQAASAFDQARRVGLPYRMFWYQFDIFEVYLAEGRYQDVINLSTATLQATGGLEEVYYYRGLARQALDQADDAAVDFRAALDYNPLYTPASDALAALEVSTP